MKLKIYSVKPCIDENHLEAEIRAEIKDIEATYKKLKPIFKDMEFSKGLKVIRITKEPTTVLIFDDGKIILRKLKSERDIFSILKELSSVLQ